jgi:hypothetical protein
LWSAAQVLIGDNLRADLTLADWFDPNSNTKVGSGV